MPSTSSGASSVAANGFIATIVAEANSAGTTTTPAARASPQPMLLAMVLLPAEQCGLFELLDQVGQAAWPQMRVVHPGPHRIGGVVAVQSGGHRHRNTAPQSPTQVAFALTGREHEQDHAVLAGRGSQLPVGGDLVAQAGQAFGAVVEFQEESHASVADGPGTGPVGAHDVTPDIGALGLGLPEQMRVVGLIPGAGVQVDEDTVDPQTVSQPGAGRSKIGRASWRHKAQTLDSSTE